MTHRRVMQLTSMFVFNVDDDDEDADDINDVYIEVMTKINN